MIPTVSNFAAGCARSSIAIKVSMPAPVDIELYFSGHVLIAFQAKGQELVLRKQHLTERMNAHVTMLAVNQVGEGLSSADFEARWLALARDNKISSTAA